MSEVKDKVWFLREGLFAKYVVALVGLVVFVLAVNGAMEIWITYGGIKRSLADGMSREGGSDAKGSTVPGRPGAPVLLVTRASFNHRPRAPRRLRASAATGAAGQPAVGARRPGPRTAPHDAPDDHAGQQRHFSRDVRPTERPRGTSFSPAYRRRAAVHVDLADACRRQHHRRRDRSRLPRRLLDRRPGRQGGFAYMIDPRARCWRRSNGPGSARTFGAAAGRRRH